MTTQTNAAVSSAVQNTTATGVPMPDTDIDGKPLVEFLKNPPKKDLKAAYAAMDAAYDIQFGKDGIEDTQAKLTGLQGKVGEQVYAIAKLAREHCGDRLMIVHSYFKALCVKAEEYKQNWYIAKYKEQKPIGQLIPLWAQYKSRIAKGIEKGLDPLEPVDDSAPEGSDRYSPKYATAAQYSTAVQAIEKEERSTGSQAGEERNSEKQTTTTLQLVTKGWSLKLAASMDVLCKALNGLTHEEQDKFADPIKDLAAQVMTYSNTAHREAVGDTRTEAQRAVGPETTEELDPGTQAAMQAAIDKEDTADQHKAHGKHGKRRGARAA